MNNVYTMRRSPATVTAAAGVLMLGYAAAMLLQAQYDASDRASTARTPSTLKVGQYDEGGESPTIGANYSDFTPNIGSKFFDDASNQFVANLSDGIESLGTEFATVIEDNFWDLVLR